MELVEKRINRYCVYFNTCLVSLLMMNPHIFPMWFYCILTTTECNKTKQQQKAALGFRADRAVERRRCRKDGRQIESWLCVLFDLFLLMLVCFLSILCSLQMYLEGQAEVVLLKQWWSVAESKGCFACIQLL